MIKTKPAYSPWQSSGSRLKLGLKDHKIYWYVPIEASYTQITVATNTAPIIRSPVTEVNIVVRSAVPTDDEYTVGFPLDQEGDKMYISSW